MYVLVDFNHISSVSSVRQGWYTSRPTGTSFKIIVSQSVNQYSVTRIGLPKRWDDEIPAYAHKP